MIPTLKIQCSDVLCVEDFMNVRNDLYETMVEPFVIAVGFK